MRPILIISVLLSLVGCATGATPPPEPDMSRLVNVNTQLPPQLYGSETARLPASQGDE